MILSQGTMTAPAEDAWARSHRDPLGHVVIADGRVLRVVDESWRPVYKRLRANRLACAMVDDGRLIGAREVAPAAAPAALRDAVGRGRFLLEHERVAFPSFPYEWPAEMLHKAAKLTLDLAGSFLDDGLRLKDATPFNVLFRGPRPVFIDVLSFEARPPGDPLWRPEGQFTQAMLLPLLLAQRFGLAPHRAFLVQREGIALAGRHRPLELELLGRSIEVDGIPQRFGNRHALGQLLQRDFGRALTFPTKFVV